MRSSLMLPILLLFVIFMSTHQAQNPTCQPVSSSETYEKTLFVFVVESGTMNAGIKYVIQQMACTIPEADKLRTYILDYTDENVVIPSSESAFFTSKELSTKIAGSLAGATSTDPQCPRMTSVHKKFSEESVVRGFTKVKYIAVHMDSDCSPPAGTTSNWLKINMKYESIPRNLWYIQDQRRMDLLKTNEAEAPQFLKDASNKIIGKLLGDDSIGRSAAADSSSSNCENSDKTSLYIIIALGIGEVITIAFAIVFVVLWRKGKGKSEDSKDQEKGKPDKKKKKGDKKADTSKISEEEKSGDKGGDQNGNQTGGQ